MGQMDLVAALRWVLWPAYDITRRATLVFDLPSHVVNDPNRDERMALKKFPSGRLL